VILHCNFEELRALREGARVVLDEGRERQGSVAAPSTDRARVEQLVRRLDGDLTIETLAEQRAVRRAVRTIVRTLRREMEAEVVTTHPGGEGAVAAYFDFAYALTVLDRVQEMGREMEALIELVSGEPPDADLAETFIFPD